MEKQHQDPPPSTAGGDVPSTTRGPPRKRGRKSQNRRDLKRQDTLRERQGPRTMDSISQQLERTLRCNELTDIPTLMITVLTSRVFVAGATRGLGMIILCLYRHSLRYPLNRAQISINALYRIGLLLIANRICVAAQRYSAGHNLGQWESYFFDNSVFQSLIQGVSESFRPIASLVASFGWTMINDVAYVTRIPITRVSQSRRAYYISWRNLGETLNFYGQLGEATAAQRLAFYAVSTIPGARWQLVPDIGWTIMNEAEILPPEYGPDDLTRDISAIGDMLRTCQLRFGLKSSFSMDAESPTRDMLVSSQLTLSCGLIYRAPQERRRMDEPLPEDDIRLEFPPGHDSFWSTIPVELKPLDFNNAAAHLIGDFNGAVDQESLFRHRVNEAIYTERNVATILVNGCAPQEVVDRR